MVVALQSAKRVARTRRRVTSARRCPSESAWGTPLPRILTNSFFSRAVFITVVGLGALTGIRVAAQEPQLETTLDLTPPGIQPLNADSLLAACRDTSLDSDVKW